MIQVVVEGKGPVNVYYGWREIADCARKLKKQSAIAVKISNEGKDSVSDEEVVEYGLDTMESKFIIAQVGIMAGMRRTGNALTEEEAGDILDMTPSVLKQIWPYFMEKYNEYIDVTAENIAEKEAAKK